MVLYAANSAGERGPFRIAVALDIGRQAFLTNDLGSQRVTELRALVLDQMEI